MTKFFNYYNSLCVGANSPNIFSFDPYVIAIKELLVSELAQVVFYIEKLKDLGEDMSIYRDKVIEFISVLVVNLDFQRENFFNIVLDLYNNKTSLHELYNSICIEKDIVPDKLDFESSDLSTKEAIIKSLNEHEKSLSYDENLFPHNKKILYQIMVNLVLNACNCLIDLKNYGFDFVEAKEEVLRLFNASNFPSENESEWIQKIKDFSKCNYKIIKKLDEIISQKYGPVSKFDVPLSIKKGKAILVSGYNFADLEKILDSVSDLDINVYTHHEIIRAFQYLKFRNYEKLCAHYQRSNNNFSLDFSSFPGPIYISRNSTPKIDVIRGQIYTSAKYPSFGIAKVENDDFSKMIEYALESKGFEENVNIGCISIGYDESDINKLVDDLVVKFEKSEISHIAIIGLFDKLIEQNDYIDSFLEKIPDDCYVISFYKSENTANSCRISTFLDLPLLYKILEKLINRIDNPSKYISVFHLDCTSNIVSHVFNLIHLGISKIFLGPCCPNILNPILLDGLKNLFSISEISKPEEDIKNILDN